MVKYVRTQSDRLGAWLCVIGGAVMLIAGYLGVWTTEETAKQLPYVASGGMAGMFLVGLGVLLWMSADLGDEWRKLHAINRHLVETSQLPAPVMTLWDEHNHRSMAEQGPSEVALP